VEVAGDSMRPTLVPGDRLLVVPWPRHLLRPGHLVAVPDPRDPGRTLVKRVTATTRRTLTLAGDDPARSTDSRHFGPVARTAVLGRAVYRYAPTARAGPVR
jgi:nickel-type superoxide dismutase maturation protease